MPETLTPDQQRFKNWYAKHRKSRNAARRKQYARDSEFRLRTIQRVRVRYWDSRPKVVLKKINKHVKPSFKLNTGEPAYGMADVAALFGREKRTMLSWVKMAVLPIPLHMAAGRGGIRVYTEDEFRLLQKHAPLLAWPKRTLAKSVFANTVRRDMALLRRGYLTTASEEGTDGEDHAATDAPARREKRTRARSRRRSATPAAR